jgi:DNA end-binding protein Ku
MPGASSWKGFLKLSFVTCAVRLTPATTDTEHVHFHLINPDTGNRIKMKPHDADTDEVLARKELVKGYEYEKGNYTLMDDEEIDALKIESTQTIDIERFVRVADIDRRYFDTPYYLVPGNKMAIESYKVIQQSIAEEKLIGIAKLVMAGRERVVAIEPREHGLIVTTLRSPDELRDYEELFDEIDNKSLNKEMLKLGKQLIGRMTGSFDPKIFEDRYQEALRELVEAKTKGIERKQPKVERPSNVVNLFDALKKSVESRSGSAASRGKTSAKTSHRTHVVHRVKKTTRKVRKAS